MFKSDIVRICVLLRKDSDDFKGEMMSAHNRTVYLKKLLPDAEITTYVLREYFSSIYKWQKKALIQKKTKGFELDKIYYKALWFPFSIVDYILRKIGLKPFLTLLRIKSFTKKFKDYDLIIAHSLYAGFLAQCIKKKFGIPYTVTWHGSDVHTVPFINSSMRNLVESIMNQANANLFVSKNLREISDKIISTDNKHVLYNGVNTSSFYPRSKEEIVKSKEKYGLNKDELHVAFVGNMLPVKNILILPEIFEIVSKSHIGSIIQFHFVGDGNQKDELRTLCNEKDLHARFWGNVSPSLIPEIINCMNLIVLPSLKEGLPLIILEALACGIQAVASKTGGIPEVLNPENVIELDDQFIPNFASAIMNSLEHPRDVKLDRIFTWENTSKIEETIIKHII